MTKVVVWVLLIAFLVGGIFFSNWLDQRLGIHPGFAMFALIVGASAVLSGVIELQWRKPPPTVGANAPATKGSASTTGPRDKVCPNSKLGIVGLLVLGRGGPSTSRYDDAGRRARELTW